MTPQFQQHAQHTEPGCLSRMFPAVLAAAILIATFAPVALASAAECQGADLSRGSAIEGITSWKDTSLGIRPLTLTVQRDLYGELVPSPILEAAPPVRSIRFSRGNMENRGMDTLNLCWSQSLRKNAVVNQAMIKSIGKSPAKAFTQIMRLPATPYNGRRPVIKTGLTLPEIDITAHYRTPSIIGPVQENLKADQSYNPSLNQAVAMRPSPGESLTLFEGRPVLATDTLKTGFRLPVNESLRMNMTTTQALHAGNCASGCP